MRASVGLSASAGAAATAVSPLGPAVERVLARLGALLSRATEYEQVEAAKALVRSADAAAVASRARVRDAKETFSAVSERRMGQQQELTALLHRKGSWQSKDLLTFSELCRSEHELTAAFEAGRRALREAEEAGEATQAAYLNALRSHYHEEQLWSEKGRRLSTYSTLALFLLNSGLFLASITFIEPRRREALAERVVNESRALVREDMVRTRPGVARETNLPRTCRAASN
jgi:sensitive to high expression protein 9